MEFLCNKKYDDHMNSFKTNKTIEKNERKKFFIKKKRSNIES